MTLPVDTPLSLNQRLSLGGWALIASLFIGASLLLAGWLLLPWWLSTALSNPEEIARAQSSFTLSMALGIGVMSLVGTIGGALTGSVLARAYGWLRGVVGAILTAVFPIPLGLAPAVYFMYLALYLARR